MESCQPQWSPALEWRLELQQQLLTTRGCRAKTIPMMKCVYANKWYHIICVDTTVDLNSSICKPSFAIFRGDLKLNISLNLSISFTPLPKKKDEKSSRWTQRKTFAGSRVGTLAAFVINNLRMDLLIDNHMMYMILIFWCKYTHSEDSIWTLTSDKTLVISGSNHEVIEQTASIDTTEPSMSISKQRGVKSTNTLGPLKLGKHIISVLKCAGAREMRESILKVDAQLPPKQDSNTVSFSVLARTLASPVSSSCDLSRASSWLAESRKKLCRIFLSLPP